MKHILQIVGGAIGVASFLMLCTWLASSNNSVHGQQAVPVPKAVPVVQPKEEPKKKDDKVGNPGDIPVVNPKKIERDAPPTAVESSDQATLPIGLVKNKLEALKSGSTVYVAVNALRIDSKRKCWLHPHTLTGQKGNDRVVQIRRDGEGYHVVIERLDHQWEAQDVDGTAQKWIPVKSVTVKEE